MRDSVTVDKKEATSDPRDGAQPTLTFLFKTAGARTILALVLTATLSALLDLTGIAMIFPYLHIAIHPELLDRYASAEWAMGLGRGMDANVLLVGLTAGLLLAQVIKAILQTGLLRYQYRSLARFTADLTNDTVERLLYAQYNVFQRTPASELAGIAYSNTVHSTIAIQSLIQILSEGVFLVLLVGAFLIWQPVLALICLAIFGVAGIVLYRTVVRRISVLGANQSRAEMLRHRLLFSLINAMRDIRIMGLGPLFNARNREISALYTDAAWRYNFAGSIPRIAIELLVMLLLISAVGVFIVLHIPLDQVAPALGVAALGAARALPGLSRLIAAVNNLRFYRAFVARLIEVRQELSAARIVRVEDHLRFDSVITLTNVGFQYEDHWVVRDANIAIRRGESVGLVGTSGAGKTTILDMFTGLQRASEGTFRCDGVAYNPFLSLSMTRLIGYVPQSIALLDASIAYNIAFEHNPDPTRISTALHTANLATFVGSLPNGSETQVGENGLRLSGGQRQRIGIARALYRNPAILVFDEATSALDSVTERELSDEIAKMHGNVTTLIATHRLSTVARCDRIYVMDTARIVDSGTHDELLVRCQVYRRLVEATDKAGSSNE